MSKPSISDAIDDVLMTAGPVLDSWKESNINMKAHERSQASWDRVREYSQSLRSQDDVLSVAKHLLTLLQEDEPDPLELADSIADAKDVIYRLPINR